MTLAFVFDSVGAGEWLLLLAVLLVVMGPKRLPEVLRKFGSQYAKFRRAADSFKRQLMEMDTELERAVNSAEREAEEAARIPDVTQLDTPPSDTPPEPPEGRDAPPDDFGAPPEDYDAPPPEDFGAPSEGDDGRPNEPVKPDGNRDAQEP